MLTLSGRMCVGKVQIQSLVSSLFFPFGGGMRCFNHTIPPNLVMLKLLGKNTDYNLNVFPHWQKQNTTKPFTISYLKGLCFRTSHQHFSMKVVAFQLDKNKAI